MTVSIPTSRSISNAEGSTPMRLCARGPSGTLTASTPAALSARHCSSIGFGSTPFGGTISTLVTISPRASFAPQRDFSASGTGVTSGGACTCARHDDARLARHDAGDVVTDFLDVL